MTSRLMLRIPDHPVDPLFLERWSPRAFDGSEVPDADLATHLRGGALGAVGVQLAALAFPLRQARRRELGALPVAAHPLEPELGAHRLGAGLHRLGQPADDRPQDRRARALDHAQLRRRRRLGQPRLQATRMGYHAHGMSGIQYELARAELGLPDRYAAQRRLRDRPDRRSRPARREAAGPRASFGPQAAERVRPSGPVSGLEGAAAALQQLVDRDARCGRARLPALGRPPRPSAHPLRLSRARRRARGRGASRRRRDTAGKRDHPPSARKRGVVRQSVPLRAATARKGHLDRYRPISAGADPGGARAFVRLAGARLPRHRRAPPAGLLAPAARAAGVVRPPRGAALAALAQPDRGAASPGRHRPGLACHLALGLGRAERGHRACPQARPSRSGPASRDLLSGPL